MRIAMLLAGVILISPLFLSAQGLVPCEGPECQFCHLVQLGDNVIDFLVTISAAIGAILIAVAGFRMVTSGGNEAQRTAATQQLTNIVVGFIIILSAWLIVDTVMKLLAGGGTPLGPWNQIQCVTLPIYGDGGGSHSGPECANGFDDDGDGLIDGEDPECLTSSFEDARAPQCSDGVDNDGDGKIDENDPDCLEDIGMVGAPEPFVYDPTDDNEWNESSVGGSFGLAESVLPAQSGHKSATLSSFLSCVSNRAMEGRYYITSISDNMIASGQKTWQQCNAGQCQHTTNSCHYGGTSCVGESYAADIRVSNTSDAQEQSILDAAVACGGWGQHEGNHIHISKGQACGCY